MTFKPDPEPRNNGYRSFNPSLNSYDVNPHIKGTWQHRSFEKGWAWAKAKYERDERESQQRSEVKRKEDEAWFNIKCSCPWYLEDSTCMATNMFCVKEHCAPYYFKVDVYVER